jgi:hypothetical protein
MRLSVPIIALAFVFPLLCAWKPVVPLGYASPDGGAWIREEQVAPDPGTDQLLPTVRLRLFERGVPGSLDLLDGLPDLCGVDIRWVDHLHVALDLSEEWGPRLRAYDGEPWGDVTLGVQLDRRLVKMEQDSPDGSRRLLVIAQCESGQWNLYVRTRNEPDYMPAKGWDDPQLFGGFSEQQPLEAIEWTGARSACVVVAFQRYDVTLRSQAGGVHVDWVFDPGYKRALAPQLRLAPIKDPGKGDFSYLKKLIKRLI